MIRNLNSSRYSFTREPYINPLIVFDLYGWLSDTGDSVVSVDIDGSNESNRYFADSIEVQESSGASPTVRAARGDEAFSYQYLGRSFTGIHLLRVGQSGGGSGIFNSILFVTLSEDTSVDLAAGKSTSRKRTLIKTIGSLPLGDRFDGKVRYWFGLLYVSGCFLHQPNQKLKRWVFVI